MGRQVTSSSVDLVEAPAAVFVGREAEVAALRAAFETASTGRAQTVVVEGEAGIGKTTLVEHFVGGLTGVRVLRCAGDESEAHVPFALADQLLRSAGDASGSLDATQHVPVGMELLELMAAAPEPTVVVIDEGHLVDAESLRAMLFATRRLGGLRVLVLLIIRGEIAEVLPEGWAKLATEPTGGTLAVMPLEPRQVSALGAALGVVMTPGAAQRLWEHTNGNPLHTRAVLDDLPDADLWQHEHRVLPVPRSYAQLVRRQLRRCSPEVTEAIEAASVLGVRAPVRAVLALSGLALETIDDATASGIVRLDDGPLGTHVTFAHPLARAAIYEALPQARRSALHAAAATLEEDPAVAIRHRVEAATVADQALVTELEEQARFEMANGRWGVAVSNLLAASRLATRQADRDRLALDALEAMMYSGDGAAARRLAEQMTFGEGPRRDSVLAYLAMFAGDLTAAQRMLRRAWDRRGLAADDRLSATIAQRSAFLATARLRGGEAIDWVARATALDPGDPASGLLLAPSLALGASFVGRRADAHAALDRWLEDPAAPRPGAGFVLLAIKGNLLLAEGDLAAAGQAFETSARESLSEGLLVVSAMSLSGLTRVGYLSGDWDGAVVAAERAIALAVESDDRWVIAQARWSASVVHAARGEWTAAESHVRAIREQAPTFERHKAMESMAAAALAAARERPADVLDAVAAIEAMRPAEGVDDPAFFQWHHLKGYALVDLGRHDAADAFLTETFALAKARANPLLEARITHARAKLEFARHRPDAAVERFEEALALVERLGMPYELALIELNLGQVLRRLGGRRAAAATLMSAHGRLGALGARPALDRCETELAACGLSPAARKGRDYSALTPQEVAVSRLVISGMTNREVSDQLMLSTKTIEFHLSNVYTKLGVRSRSELRARARANELAL
jgi:DNA-binding CsgD family transcriptional regulator